MLIDERPDMCVIAEAGNGHDAVEITRQLLPDLVIMDLSMPRMNGLKATEMLKTELPSVNILVLTSYDDECYFKQMCRAKVSGYVLKRSAGDELVRAIRKVAMGQFYVDEELAARMLTRQSAVSSVSMQNTAKGLTEREEEVLRGVASGYTNKELATMLTLSVKTVETHKVRICEKLCLRSRADFVQYALRQGWLDQTRSFARTTMPAA